MIRNYIKIAWRNLVSNKVYSLLNILGLAAGMAVALMIGLWVSYQYSYDRFLPDNSRLYQVMRNFYSNGDTLTFASTSLKLADALRNNIPEFEHVAETDNWGRHGLMVGNSKFYWYGVQAGGDFLKMFRYPFIYGNANAALKDPYSIVLTESAAKALFGRADVINKLVRVDNHDNLKVTGVIKDVPANSTFQFKYVIPFSYYEATKSFVKSARTGSFSFNAFSVYAELKPGVSFGAVSAKIRDIEKGEKDNVNAVNSTVILYPMRRWHLFNEYKNGQANSGFIDYVRMFTLIGALVLLIACINFINLSTARSEKRAREVGVRKAVGSRRKDLILQFLIESCLITFISFLFTVLVVQLCLPAFNALTGTSISVPYGSALFWIVAIACVLFTGLLAGSRPALYLSSFNPVKVLKGAIHAGKSGSISRKALVVMQFTCSIALIISTVIIYRQIQYAKNRPIGYQVNRLMTTDGNTDIYRNFDALKNDLLQSGAVTAVTTSTSPATGVEWHTDLDMFPGKRPGETVEMGCIVISDDYFKTLGMNMLTGRDFITGFKADSDNVIFNEAAIKRLRIKNPINQLITWGGHRYRIIGVVKDAQMNSPYSAADPTMFTFSLNSPNGNIIYRLSSNLNTHAAVKKISPIFNKYNPAYPYDYRFVDKQYNQKFREEELIGKLAGIFAGLAIFISCLGLFGLAAFVAEQRTKEIGIRKVLGATVSQVWLMLSKDFIWLVTLSCVIASPLAFYFLKKWLMNYDYHITIGLWVFIVSAAAAILITVATISFQSIKAALANPVKSLRSE